MLRLWGDRGPVGFTGTALLWALGGGSLIYYLFFWGESKKGLSYGKKRSRRKKGSAAPLGLDNPGNLCYVNAVLQALSSCKKAFVPWVCERSEKNDFCSALHALLRAINREESEEAPQLKELLSALRSKGWVLDPREQDAHELFNVFLTTLEEEGEETIKKTRKRRNSLNEALSFTDEDDALTGIIARNATIAAGSSSSLNSPVESLHPFSGTLANKLIKASSDLVVPVSSNYFNNVTLSLPNIKRGRITLQTLLESFTSKEELDSGVVKQTCFAKLPPCICFHIQRTAFDGGYASKRSDRVYFPQILDMSSFSYGSLRAREYRSSRHNSMPPESLSSNSAAFEGAKGPRGGVYLLKAVIQHAGAINSGHYVTYRVNAAGKWYFTSDLYVEEVEFAGVLEANPYMLFYEKECGV